MFSDQAIAVITGIHSGNGELEPFTQAVQDRFEQLLPGLEQNQGDYCYDGNRCTPREVSWRVGIIEDMTPEQVTAGELDDCIVATWHERASAEHWYRYEKDWGWDD